MDGPPQRSSPWLNLGSYQLGIVGCRRWDGNPGVAFARLDYDRKSGLHGHTQERRGARAPASAASAFAAAPGQTRPFGFRPL